jgi:tetratricopeptide (TPR) repeat protein
MSAQKIALIIGVAAVAGFFIWNTYNGPLWIRDKDTDTQAATTTFSAAAASSENANVTVPGGVEINYSYEAKSSSTPEKEVKMDAAAPSLTRPVIIPASFSPEDASTTRVSIGKLIDAIKQNPENGALWAELGLKRKGIEDYQGAKEAYEYALKFLPSSPLLADNLGVIFADYLKDYPKAEQYYRLALSWDSKTDYRYLRLFDFYTYSLKDRSKAKAILEEGLREIPGHQGFQSLLEEMN